MKCSRRSGLSFDNQVTIVSYNLDNYEDRKPDSDDSNKLAGRIYPQEGNRLKVAKKKFEKRKRFD